MFAGSRCIQQLQSNGCRCRGLFILVFAFNDTAIRICVIAFAFVVGAFAAVATAGVLFCCKFYFCIVR